MGRKETKNLTENPVAHPKLFGRQSLPMIDFAFIHQPSVGRKLTNSFLLAGGASSVREPHRKVLWLKSRPVFPDGRGRLDEGNEAVCHSAGTTCNKAGASPIPNGSSGREDNQVARIGPGQLDGSPSTELPSRILSFLEMTWFRIFSRGTAPILTLYLASLPNHFVSKQRRSAMRAR